MNLFDLINSDEFDGLVRHALTVFGGITVYSNDFDPAQWQTLVGGAVAILGVLWSMANKKYMRNGAKPSA